MENSTFNQRLTDHMSSDERSFEYIRDTMDRIEKSQHKAETNHWAHVQESTGALEKKYTELSERFSLLHEDVVGMKVDSSTVKSDVNWLKQFFWVVATASIGSLVTGVITLILKLKS